MEAGIKKRRYQLEEASNIVEAIREGQVDALLVSDEQQGDQVYVLKGSDHIYRVIVEEMLEGYATLAKDGTVLFCNRNFASIMNCPLENVMGSSVFSFIKPEDIPIFSWILRTRPKGFRSEFVFFAGNGSCIPVHIAVNSITIDSDPYICMIVADLSQQKRQEKLTQFVFNQSTDAILVCNNAGRILQANTASLQLIGCELVGKTFNEALELIDERSEARISLQDVGSNEFIKREIRLIDPNGDLCYLIASITHLLAWESGDFFGYLVTLTNITEMKKYAAELSRLDRLNLVGEMAASIGHEVRNPLTTVRGYLQMFFEKKPFESYRGSIQIMIEELDRANTIITDFLSLAKNKSVNLLPTNLNQVIQAIFPLMQADAFRRNSEIVLELSPVPDVRADEQELRQCILNLVRNGLDAMPNGGNIMIGTRIQQGEIRIYVADQGTGIPESIRDKLGTPFVTTKEDGTGLGLPVCYSIAARNKARIEVATSKRGTVFTLAFNKNTRQNREQPDPV